MSFLERIREATIGFRGYPDLARDKASGFGYLSVLLLIVIAIAAVIQSVSMTRYLESLAQRLQAGPDFTVTHGQLDFRGPMPYRYYDEAPYVLVMVDTTGKTGPEAIRETAAGLLFTRDQVYQARWGGSVAATPLRQLLPGTVTRDEIARIVPGLWRAVPFTYLFLFLFQVGAKAVDACVLALIGQRYGRRLGHSVPFGLSFKLSLYAMTLPIILQWLGPGFSTVPLDLSGVLGFAVWWGLATLYVTRGLRAYYE
ncbi:MAG TPA: DUF1189 family protein [Symbiobacteriaceae bacterium]|nr:DUF1189 family protein [Symbiobacteriaceae bacterium]